MASTDSKAFRSKHDTHTTLLVKIDPVQQSIEYIQMYLRVCEYIAFQSIKLRCNADALMRASGPMQSKMMQHEFLAAASEFGTYQSLADSTKCYTVAGLPGFPSCPNATCLFKCQLKHAAGMLSNSLAKVWIALCIYTAGMYKRPKLGKQARPRQAIQQAIG